MDPVNPQTEQTASVEKQASQATHNSNNWSRDVLEKVAMAGIIEQRKTRKWNIIFKVLFFLYVTFILVMLFSKSSNKPQLDLWGNETTEQSNQHIALVRLDGVISADEKANAESLSRTLRLAAQDDDVEGIVIVANSPGGSPVQSSLVYETIKAIKAKYPNKKILTSVTDVCASGCYYIVAASDEIYANKSSIVGSIGVISQGFGYGETMKKLGLDARTFTAGKYKDFMDPSRPVKPHELAHLKNLLDGLHQHFIDAVKVGRGDRLANNPDLFTGLFWTGEASLALGLIDGVATPNEVAKMIGNFPVVDYAPSDPLEKVLERFGAEASDVVTESIDKIGRPKQKFELR